MLSIALLVVFCGAVLIVQLREWRAQPAAGINSSFGSVENGITARDILVIRQPHFWRSLKFFHIVTLASIFSKPHKMCNGGIGFAAD